MKLNCSLGLDDSGREPDSLGRLYDLGTETASWFSGLCELRDYAYPLNVRSQSYLTRLVRYTAYLDFVPVRFSLAVSIKCLNPFQHQAEEMGNCCGIYTTGQHSPPFIWAKAKQDFRPERSMFGV
jgi:hypothetical protein